MSAAKTKRLKTVFEYFKDKGETQETFAQRLGLTQAHFSRLIRGLSPFLFQHGLLLEYVYNVNAEWLETGKGDMFREVSLEKPDRTLKNIATNYAVMDEIKRESLLQYSKELSNTPKTRALKVADKKAGYGK